MLRPHGIEAVPEETARVARAAFPRGNVYLRMRDALGNLYEDEAFAPLFPALGQPAEAPWRLALVTVMQFAEGLSDRQAADAVRSRMTTVPLGKAARATRAVSAGIVPIGSGWRLMADPSVSREAGNHAPERVTVQFADSIWLMSASQTASGRSAAKRR